MTKRGLTTRRKVIRMVHAGGLSVREMAYVCNVSTQRVYQIIQDERLPLPQEANHREPTAD